MVRTISRIRGLLAIGAMLAGCAGQPPAVSDDMKTIGGELPVDFSGSWQRNYARGNDVESAFREAFYQLNRSLPDQRMPGSPVPSGPSGRDRDSLVALARLAEMITRPDVLTIVQDEIEVRVDRKDDFSMLCTFFDGVARPTVTPYGTEVCGWDGHELVSQLILPAGLRVVHRFAISADRQQLRVITTVASKTARVPVTIRRFYSRFEHPQSGFNCIETLSMKRVCSTGELTP